MYFINIILPLSNYFLSFTDNILAIMVNEELLEKKSNEYKKWLYGPLSPNNTGCFKSLWTSLLST